MRSALKTFSLPQSACLNIALLGLCKLGNFGFMKDFALVRQSKLKVNYLNSENILLKFSLFKKNNLYF